MCRPTHQESPASGGADTGCATTEQGDSNGGGISWVTETAGDPNKATTPPTGTSSNAEVDSDPGNDWLAAAASNDQTKQKPRVAASTAEATASSPAAPGGWMLTRTVGVSTEDGSAQNNAGKAGAGASAVNNAAATKPRKWKGRVFASAARRIGGWLSPRALGVPTGDESVDRDDDEGGDGDFQGVRVTIETQTDDDIEAVTERWATEKGGGSKLPPWAKPWVPSPKHQVVPDPAPEATSAPSGQTKKKASMENAESGIRYV